MEGWCLNLAKVVSLLLFHLCFPCSSVELISSVEEAGRSKACPGETVVFTCTIQVTSLLEWRTGPTEMGRVQFSPDQIGTAEGVQDIGEFQAVLTRLKRNHDNTYLMESTLSGTVTRMVNGTTVYCTDGLNSETNHSQLLLQDPPLSLSPVTYQVLSYNRGDVTISVHWEHREGEAVDNFTITATASGDTVSAVHTSPPPANLSLPYNVQYNLSVVAHSCADTVAGSATYEEAGCSVPTPPTGGSVGHFKSASKGSEITYHCLPGHLLKGPSTAICTSNLTWIPDSSEVNCTLLPAQNTTAGSGSDTEDLQLLSYSTAIATTAVLCSVTSLIIGVLLGALLYHIINRARSKPPTPPHNPLPQGVINEEVDISTTKQKKASGHRGEAFHLNLNEAYAFVEKKTRQV